jgi:hypothetical protein
MDVLFFILMIELIAVAIYSSIHIAHDHWAPKSGQTLDANAVITDVSYKKSSLTDRFKTTVTFSDGFAYSSYKTKTKLGFLKKTFSVTEEIKQ